MSIVDIHPEELLDKLAQGALSPSEAERLDAHLARCEVCRFELALREDLSEDVAARELAAPPQLLSQVPVVTRATPSRVRRWSVASVAAAAVFVLAAGALAAIAGPRFWSPPKHVDASTAAGNSTAAQLAKASKSPRSTAHSVTPRSDEPAPLAVPSEAPHIEAPHIEAPQRTVSSRRVPSAPLPAASSEADNASALFGAANRARRNGNVGLAKSLYAELQSRYPRSSEASTSRVTLGTLLLNGDPVAALANFDAYLASGARSLAAEALVGRARAYRALGRRAESLRAWQEVEARFPTSVYAAEAREMTKTANAP
jgi:TolA-binding protein